MTCEEMIYSNEYADFTINFLEGIEGAKEIYNTGCVNAITQKLGILHIPRPVDFLTNLERVPYSFVPKLFGLMDSTNIESVGVKRVKNDAFLGLDGENVIIGVIDTGITYTDPLFQTTDGKTRIGVIWDQTIEGLEKGDENNGVEEELRPYYGTAYFATDINEALLQDVPYERVPTRDENGHGTFLAGVAAGNENRENDFVGIASGAEIAVVKLKEAKPYLKEYFGVPRDILSYEETDIIYAVQYLLRYADYQNKPLSILIGLGTSNGGHLGLTSLERYLTSILENPGVMVSVPAGNEGNERLHFAGRLEGLERRQEVEFNIGNGEDALVLEFWGGAPTTFAVGLVTPEGDNISLITPRFGKEEELRLPLSDTTIYVAYQLVETYSGDELIFIRLLNPTPGLWRLIVYADGENLRSYNIWMPLRQFLKQDTYFLQGNPDNTVTIPGNAPLVTTVTAYNHQNGSIYANASRGFLERDITKPDLTAPGVGVSGPGLRGNFITKTGTSVAAAHAAGIFALFQEWNERNPELGPYYAAQVQSFFLKSAIRDVNLEYPNVIWGYGVIEIDRALDQFRVLDL